MKCANCGIFFSQLPCPDCNWKGNNISKEVNPEKMIRPSELKGQSAVNRPFESHHDPEERLVKPSEFRKKEEDEPIIEDEPEERLVKPSDFRKKEKIEPIVEDEPEERLVKPSEMVKSKNKEIEDEPEERLIKPSEMNPRIKGSPQLIDSDEDGERLVKPSEMKNRIVNPTQGINSVRSGLQKVNDKMVSNKDEKFKTNVKDTLMEVISLLEKLIEE